MDFGIISLGNHAVNRIIPAISKSGNRIVAIYSTDREKGTKISRELGAEYFGDIDKMVRHGYEASYISSPNNLHFEYARKSLERGKHVLLEKPMTLSVDNSERLVDLSIKEGRRLKLGFHLRFHPGIRVIKEHVESGRLGKVMAMSGNFSSLSRRSGSKTWWDMPESAGGGAIVGRGVHVMDSFVFLLGREIESVMAFNTPRCQTIEETFSILARYKSGIIAHALSSRSIPGGSNDLIVLGSEHVAKLTNAFDTKVNSKLIVDDTELSSYSDYDMYEAEIKDFTSNGNTIADAVDGLLSTRLHIGAQKSACEGREIFI